MIAGRDHAALADDLLAETRARGGSAPVDLERFWEDDARAHADPFASACPQVPLGLGANMGECVFAELGLDEDWYRFRHDPAWRSQLFRAYNDRAERIVGRRLLEESIPDPSRRWPSVKGLHDVFEARQVWHHESYWLMPAADSPDALRALLDRVEERLTDLRTFLLPDGWDEAHRRLTALGVPPPRYRWQRGPVTFATSVFGVENLIFLILDEPDLARRFGELILRAMLGIADVLDREAGDTPETAPRGFGFADDNCYLMTPEMYELFAYPVLAGVFARFCPDPGDWRFQHSDSAMAHLLPLLGRLRLTGVNFGPTVAVAQIRAHLPDAIVHGVLAPFTFSRNQEHAMVREFLRDADQARSHGRGLVFTTAGSVNNGSRLVGLRLLMSAIQRYGPLTPV